MTTEPDFIGAELEFTFTITPHWLLEVLKPIELTTYVALGQYADNKTKECWPSVTKLAKDIQRSRYSTIKALQGLEEKGVIEIKERYKDKGEQTSNLYILKLVPVSMA
jgi:predicted transcriptional regulator